MKKQNFTIVIECFDSCSNSWSQLVQQGLFTLITTGKGKEIVLG